MKRIAIFTLFLCATTFGESFSGSDSLSIGGDGISFQTPGQRVPTRIKNEGNGVFSTTFSITGNPSGAAAAQEAAPVRVLPPRPLTPPRSFTDSDTFFQSVGK